MAESCKKRTGKKDRATAEAHTRKHKARRIAKDSARKALCAAVRVQNHDARKADKNTPRWRDISRRVRRLRKQRKAA